MDDTIFAPITVIGNAGVASFRISGAKTRECLRFLGIERVPQNREVKFCRIYCDISGMERQILDEVLVSFFRAPNSFTGEDVAEISIHSSTYIAKKLSEILSSVDGVRHAKAGEFSKRAFLNGKIDLMQAEAISDLINSQTDFQHQQSIRQLVGNSSNVFTKLREDLIAILAYIEAYIDFPDEDLSIDFINDIEEKIAEVVHQLENIVKNANIGKKIRNGIQVAIVGHANVGKSSLLNYFAKRDIAITTNIAGTTRDVLEVEVDFYGMKVIFFDTAGIRDSDDLVEIEGIRRAKDKMEEADIVILMMEAGSSFDEFGFLQKAIFVYNKIDLHAVNKEGVIGISVKNGDNLSVLEEKLREKIMSIASPSQNVVINRERHLESIKKSLEYLTNFSLIDIVLASENLRLAIRAIDSIIGHVGVEDLLDKIFLSFCIGK